MSKKKNKENLIEKKENASFIKKFTEKEVKQNELDFSILCVEKAKKENLIEKLKSELKNDSHKLKQLASKIEEGGERVWDVCDVKIFIDEMKKYYYFEGELVDTEDADESDLQTEINED